MKQKHPQITMTFPGIEPLTTKSILDNGATYHHLDSRDLESDLKNAQRPWKHNRRKYLNPIFSDQDYRNYNPSVFSHTIAHLESQLDYSDPYAKVVYITLFGGGNPQARKFTVKVLEWIDDKIERGGFCITIKYMNPADWGFSS